MAMNLCHCGHFGDPEHSCRCTPAQIELYRRRISGPLLDRFDLQIEVPRLPWVDIVEHRANEESDSFAEQVRRAQEIQRVRSGGGLNASLDTRAIDQYATPDKDGTALLERAMNRYKLSARAYFRILKLARTIADLESADNVSVNHIGEAIALRCLDRLA